MDQRRLQDIITRKNNQLESEATYTAGELIGQIVSLQKAEVKALEAYNKFVKETDEAIAEARKELAALTIEQVDPAEVLGI